MKKNIETKISEGANLILNGKYNLVQFKSEKERLLKHKAVCQQILDFKKENPSIPTYVVLSTGINAGAYKDSEFNKGYKKFDADKVLAVTKMAHTYNQEMGILGKPSDVTYRLALKFYNKKSHNVSDFENALSEAKGADGKRGHFAELCKNIGL